MADVTEQIKDRLGVVDVLSEYLRLERAGGNFRALCPFHSEKTPSFMVNPERNFWYCFGCQKGGDIFTFVQEMEGISFREALVRLAEKAGVELPRWEGKRLLGKEEKDEKKILLQILETATVFFQEQLEKTVLGREMKKYLFARGLTEEAIKIFRLGLNSGGWRRLLDFLLSKGYPLKEIEKAGLIVKKENAVQGDRAGYYDRFRERIIFPVLDVFGKVVGFSARIFPGGEEKTAKYINTPQTVVYDKSDVLYGFYQAKGEIKKQDRVILAEGNMDIVASFSAGVKNIVAISGTAFSERQANLIKRLTNRVSLCLDMDQAGQTATAKIIKICLENDLETDVLVLPAGNKDINDLIIADKNLWMKIAQEKSVPVMKYFFERTFEKYSVNDPRGKKMIARDLLNLIKDIADPVEKEYWLKKLGQKADIDSEVLVKVLEKVRAKKQLEKTAEETMARNKKSTKRVEDRLVFLQEQALGVLFLFKEAFSQENLLALEGIFDENYWSLARKIFSEEGLSRKEKIFLESLAVRERFDFDKEIGFQEKQEVPQVEWQAIIENIRQERKKRNLKQIARDLKVAEERGDKEAILILSQEYAKILKDF